MGLREKQRGKRREQILDAARRLIRATGGTDFPMRRLAEEAEVSLVTPYNLFGSKSGVLYALLNDSLERLDRAVDVRPSAKPVDAVLELAGIAADIYASDAAFYRPLIQFLLRRARPRRTARARSSRASCAGRARSTPRWTGAPARDGRPRAARAPAPHHVRRRARSSGSRATSTTTRSARRACTARPCWCWRSRRRPRGRGCSSGSARSSGACAERPTKKRPRAA